MKTVARLIFGWGLSLGGTAWASDTVESATPVALPTLMESVEAGGICASNQNYCVEIANAIMLLNNDDVSIRSTCEGYDATYCQGSNRYYIRTTLRVIKETPETP
ncbi:MAG: hypothetical protein AB7F86_11265 [Bdellovibrionales bacterium]